MKFIHMTDTHLVAPGEKPYGVAPEARLDACLKDIAKLHADAAFCVITGDLTENGDVAAYACLRAKLARFPLKAHLLLGNCDDRRNFFSVFGGGDTDGFAQSAINTPVGWFLFLDTLGEPGSAAGRYDAPRLAWLKARLDAAVGADIYLFMHHPPFAIGHANDRIGLGDGDAFGGALSGYKVRHIFFGHMHRPVGGQWRGIGFSGLPGLPFQIPLVPRSVATDLSDEPPMYGVVLVDPQSVIVHFDAFLHRAPLRQDD